MKKFLLEFLRRGVVACGLGPLILVVIYLILNAGVGLETLGVKEVCIGIISLSLLAFVAGGMNAIYQGERLPLMIAILIHGCVLYVSYLLTYLVNDWLEWGLIPVLVFTGIFIVGYFLIWGIIYFGMKKKTETLNRMLNEKKQRSK